MSDLWTWANDNSGGLALLGVAFPLLILAIGFLASHFRGVPTEKMLRDPASWSALAQTYQSSGSDAYFQSLDRVLGFANRWYGERLLSWRAYGTCLTLAFVYPLLALLIGWGLFNIWAPAGISIFAILARGLNAHCAWCCLPQGLP